MNRRNFLRSIALGVAAVTLRFRPESKPAATVRMVGFKGTSFLSAGYAYAPYTPLYVTGDIGGVKDSFSQGRRRQPQLHPAEVLRQARYGGYL